MSAPALLGEIRDARFAGGLQCPRCGALRVHRWGSFSGRQRYRCQRCGRTFSDLTGTPASYLKRPELLAEYARCMTDSMSIRRTAKDLGVHPSTAFRWRHRLCRALQRRPDTLTGWTETVVHRFPRSSKGQRGLPRPPRRRRHDRSTVPKDQVCVLIASDRLGHVVTAAIARERLRSSDVNEILGPNLAGAPLLIAADGRFGPICAFALGRSGIFRDSRRPGGPRGPDHLHTARAYARRLLTWLAHFRGVSTKYLGSYLAWHRALDLPARHRLRAAVLRWPHPLVQPLHSSREQSPGRCEGIPAPG